MSIHSVHSAAIVEMCEEGWANESRRSDGITTTWRISILAQEHQEVQQAFPHLTVPVGHFIVTQDDDGTLGVERFATEGALLRVWSA